MKYQACEKCEGLGYYPAANGPDDIDIEICSCIRGEVFKEAANVE